ncbi:hydroxyethylthiazole kinase, partial [Cellulomonas bogoriensis]|uniref:hydroxyethylthiazole kinase n=1 Tax=Cellulomonas bogoriensis TaxID=301388 RepID=UPI000552E149
MVEPPAPAAPVDAGSLLGACAVALDALRERRPLVQCLTNQVTVAVVADVLLAGGASPVMASAPGEAQELAGSADAMLVNLGTMPADHRATVPGAVEAACAAGVPWTLDPVGVGALSS